MSKQFYQVIAIGGGPAGLTASYKLSEQGIQTLTLEKGDRVGGIARTETYKGYRFDIGGHRFYTKVQEIEQLWKTILGDDFIKVPRLSRIYYDGKFFQYPIEPFDTLKKLGLREVVAILYDYFKIRIRPLPREDNFEQWVINRFGNRLYQTFFKTYTEKVWGVSCQEVRSDWAAQRIKGLSLFEAIVNALFGKNNTKSLTKEFYYPVLGPGMMWEKFQEIVENWGSPVQLNTEVVSLQHNGKRIENIIAKHQGQEINLKADHFISTMPISTLVERLDPSPPPEILQAARGLNYRDFIIVPLIIDAENLFPDNWIYIHSPEFLVGRIQNFKNWSTALLADPKKTCLGMEYFCSEGDSIWSRSNQELIELASQEITALGLLPQDTPIEDGTVIRQPRAYPVYDTKYREHLEVLKPYLQGFENLQTIGRNGMHRYNNQDHSMLTGMLAARNIMGENNDLWEVNTERSYYEDFKLDDSPKNTVSEVSSSTAKLG